ncbi:hypothetical protein CYMTET_49231 [Cymbomonas tetramitiformis]|uniref:RING-type domain-containing protein n=1 Tax=Cymbomonas tetramitiformis TaxID=36881 RepID=A0AAE0BRQ4_9CHLO|nr:hypothetical protein CYMTET_49231 [Cymbomonas tetramitiformis]
MGRRKSPSLKLKALLAGVVGLLQSYQYGLARAAEESALQLGDTAFGAVLSGEYAYYSLNISNCTGYLHLEMHALQPNTTAEAETALLLRPLQTPWILREGDNLIHSNDTLLDETAYYRGRRYHHLVVPAVLLRAAVDCQQDSVCGPLFVAVHSFPQEQRAPLSFKVEASCTAQQACPSPDFEARSSNLTQNDSTDLGDAACSGAGTCVEGACVCHIGRGGAACEELVRELWPGEPIRVEVPPGAWRHFFVNVSERVLLLMVDLVWSSGDPALLIKPYEGGSIPAHHEMANSRALVEANHSRHVLQDVSAGRFDISVHNREAPWNQETAEGNLSVHIIHFSSHACAEKCNFHGECVLQSDATWACKCDQGYSGETCADDEDAGNEAMLSLFFTAIFAMGGMGLMGVLTYAVAAYFMQVVVPQIYRAQEEAAQADDGSKTRDLDVEMLELVTIHLKATEEICADCDRCSICLAGIEPGDSLRQICACDHVFHVECIDDWLRRNLTCPLCRVPLEQELLVDDGAEENVVMSDVAD